jgi:mycofactocin system glycosyltransferase
MTSAPPDGDLAGMAVVPDEAAERHQSGRVVVSGSPMRMLRLSDAGADLVERLWRGEPVPAGAGPTALARRLLDAGIVHPDWAAATSLSSLRPPFGAQDVSVVIPVRGVVSSDLLRSVGPVAAVVVVDDASPEPVTAPERTPDGAPVLVVRHPRQRGPGGARSTGLEHVATALVAFVDADCQPRQGWLDPLLAHLADPAVAAVAPRIVALGANGDPAPRPRRLLGRYETARSALDMGARPARVRARSRVGHVPSAALLARADVVRGIGGFDAALAVGEDVDLVWRLDDAGWTVRYEPAAQVAHQHRTSTWAWARRRADYGSAAGPLARRHPGALVPVEIPLGRRADREAALVAAGADPELAAALVAHGRRALRRQLVRGLVRPWWPATLAAVALVPGRRPRRALAAAVAAAVTGVALRDWAVERPSVGPVTFVVGRIADDVAYSTGVWAGALRERTAEPLLPRLRRSPAPAPDRSSAIGSR